MKVCMFFFLHYIPIKIGVPIMCQLKHLDTISLGIPTYQPEYN